MVPGADSVGLRHKPRHKKQADWLALGDLLSASRIDETKPRHRDLALFSRKLREWDVSYDDPQAEVVLRRLDKIWLRLSENDRIKLLMTVDSIIEAEEAKLAWNISAFRERHIRLAKNAIAAVHLVQQIHRMMPPPWEGEYACIGELVTALAGFVVGSVNATVPTDKSIRMFKASKMVKSTARRLSRKTGGIHWEWIRDLVCLASKGRVDPDERTIRRYLDEQQISNSPAAPYWKRNWPIIRETARLAPENKRDAFEAAINSSNKTAGISSLRKNVGEK